MPAEPVIFNVVFSDPTTDFDDPSDVEISGTAGLNNGNTNITISPVANTNDTQYQVSVPITGTTAGTVIAAISTGVAQNKVSGVPNSAAESSATSTINWNSNPAMNVKAVYQVFDAQGNALTGELAYPTAGLDVYAMGTETQFTDKRLTYRITLKDNNNGLGLDFDTLGSTAAQDICLVNDTLQTARGSSFPDSYDISLPGYYYPDSWSTTIAQQVGFDITQRGGYINFTPEAADISTSDPLGELRSAGGVYSANLIFSYRDTAGGDPTSGHSAPNNIVLENQISSRQDTATDATMTLPMRIRNGRSEGPGITCNPSGDLWVRNTDSNTWVTLWQTKRVTNGTDSLTFDFGTVSSNSVIAPTITDIDYYTTVNTDGTVVTNNQFDDRSSVFYEWQVNYREPTTGRSVYHTYYTWFNELVLSETDFGGWKPSTMSSYNNICIDLYLVNYADCPYSGPYTFPAHCWFSDYEVLLSHASYIVKFVQ